MQSQGRVSTVTWSRASRCDVIKESRFVFLLIAREEEGKRILPNKGVDETRIIYGSRGMFDCSQTRDQQGHDVEVM